MDNNQRILDVQAEDLKVRLTEIIKQTEIKKATEVVEKESSAMPRNKIRCGEVIEGHNDKYIVKEFLTSSGEADLYICELAGNSYVVKLYNKGIKFDTEKRSAFFNFLFKQENEYIVPLLDIGRFSGSCFDIYPYYKNGDLAAREISVEVILNVVVPNMNEGLHCIHVNGIIHRDIKPNNILIQDNEDSIAIGDFGILSIVSDDCEKVTSTSSKTTGYAGIEVYSGILDRKSDYYSMGMMLLNLLKKKDAFYGKTENEILLATNRNQIPGLDRELIIKRGNQQLSDEERLEQLICGLTIKDFRKRWGYDEVARWLEKDPVQLVFEGYSIENEELVKPFHWNNTACNTLKEMSYAIGSTWEKSKREFWRGTFVEWLKPRRADISADLYEIMENSNFKKKENSDAALFRAIYAIDQDHENFCWRGNEYETMAKFVLSLSLEENNVDRGLIALLRTSSVSWFLQKRQINITIIQAVKELETLSNTNPYGAYFRMIYLFLPKQELRVLQFNDVKIVTLENLVEYLTSHKNQLENISGNLLRSESFYAWLWILGYKESSKKNSSKTVGKTKETVFALLSMIDSIFDGNQNIRELILAHSELSYIYWLTSHLEDYEYLDQRALELKRELEDVKLDSSCSPRIIRKRFTELLPAYNEFQRMIKGDPYRVAFGIHDEEMTEGIVPRTPEGYFITVANKTIVPIGYAVLRGDCNLDDTWSIIPDEHKKNAESILLEIQHELDVQLVRADNLIKSKTSSKLTGSVLLMIFFFAIFYIQSLGAFYYFSVGNIPLAVSLAIGGVALFTILMNDWQILKHNMKPAKLRQELACIEERRDSYTQKVEQNLAQNIFALDNFGVGASNNINVINEDLKGFLSEMEGAVFFRDGLLKALFSISGIANSISIGLLSARFLVPTFNVLLDRMDITPWPDKNVQVLFVTFSCIAGMFFLSKSTETNLHKAWLDSVLFPSIGVVAVFLAAIAVFVVLFVLLGAVAILGIVFVLVVLLKVDKSENRK